MNYLIYNYKLTTMIIYSCLWSNKTFEKEQNYTFRVVFQHCLISGETDIYAIDRKKKKLSY